MYLAYSNKKSWTHHIKEISQRYYYVYSEYYLIRFVGTFFGSHLWIKYKGKKPNEKSARNEMRDMQINPEWKNIFVLFSVAMMNFINGCNNTKQNFCPLK